MPFLQGHEAVFIECDVITREFVAKNRAVFMCTKSLGRNGLVVLVEVLRERGEDKVYILFAVLIIQSLQDFLTILWEVSLWEIQYYEVCHTHNV